MKKLANNIIIQTIDETHLEFIQSGEDFTYREVVTRALSPNVRTCVETEKLLAVYDDQAEITQMPDGLRVKTSGIDVILPIMKEYGEFIVKKEVKPTGEILESFDVDYSTINLDLTDAQGQFSYIMFNKDFVCRYLYNTLSFYGTISENYYCLTPKQFKRLSAMGPCKLEIYQNVVVATEKDDSFKLLMTLYKPVVQLNLIQRFLLADPECTFEFPEIDKKKIKLFASDILKLDCTGDEIIISMPGYKESHQLGEPTKPFSGIFWVKDLDYLSGTISIYYQGKFFYAISKKDGTHLFVGEAK